jgi:hypothetical protein
VVNGIIIYDFDIVYRPGKQNQNTDALSRRPNDYITKIISTDSIKAVYHAAHAELLFQ